MYNEAQKLRYLNSLTEADTFKRDKTELVFRITSDLEEMYGKDICNFTTPEILDVYRYFCTTSVTFLNHTNTYLSYYGQWCLQESLTHDGQNHFLEITMQTLSNCINKTGVSASIVTEKEVYNIVDSINNDQDAWLILGVYEGIGSKGTNYEELTCARFSDIDVKNRKIKLCTGRIIDISPKLIGIAEDASKEEFYYGSTESQRKYPLIPNGDEIYKDIDNKLVNTGDVAVKGRRVNRTFARLRKELGLSEYISLKKLKYSGMINLLNKLAEKYNVTPIEALYDNEIFKEMTKQYNITSINRVAFFQTYKDYLI